MRQFFIQFSLFILAICSSHSIYAQERCDSWAAKLESAEGIVQWKAPNLDTWNNATTGNTFCFGDRIRVLEQRSALRLANDTIVRLQQNSVITLLPEEQGFWAELLKGAAHFISRTPKLFTIKSPYINAAVEGTEFIINANDKHNSVFVYEGRVRVSNDLGQVLLADGMYSIAFANEAPSQPQSIRLHDAAEWTLYYPPLIIQADLPEEYQRLLNQEKYQALLDKVSQEKNPKHFALAASLALSIRNPEQADAFLKQAREHKQGSPEIDSVTALHSLMKGNADRAFEITSHILQQHPNNLSALVTHAYSLQAKTEIKQALEVHKKALAMQPDNLFVLARAAELYMSNGHIRSARNIIKRSLLLEPEHSHLNTLAGFIALNIFDSESAKTHFQKGLGHAQNNPMAAFGMALAFIQSGYLKEGREYMEMAVLLNPTSSLLRSYLGKIYATLDHEDWANTQYDLAKILDPNDPTPWFYQAHLAHQNNASQEALQLITTAIEKNDHRAIYRSRFLLDSDAAARSANLIKIYNRLGFAETAKNTAALAALKNPTDFASHHALVTAYSDDPQAQMLRNREVLYTRLLAPIGARELSVGTGATGIQAFPWVAPSRMGTNEHTPLFTQNGLSGHLTAFNGSQDSHGHDWLIQAIGKRISISTGEYHYKTDGFAFNNDLDVSINESNLHLQVLDSTKLFLQHQYRDQNSGDLSNSPRLPSFRSNIRDQKSSERFLGGLTHQFSNDTALIVSTSHLENQSHTRTFQRSSYTSAESNSESKHVETLLIGQKESFSYQIGAYQQAYEREGYVSTYLGSSQPVLFAQSSLGEDSDYQLIYSSLNTQPHDQWIVSGGIGSSKIQIEKQDIAKARTDINYKLGVIWMPTESLHLNAGHWKTVHNRLPSQPIWGITEPGYLSSVEDVTNFTIQKSSALKALYHEDNISVSVSLQHNWLEETSLRLQNVPTLLSKPIQQDKVSFNVEHQMSNKTSLIVATLFENSKVNAPIEVDSITHLKSFIHSFKFIHNPWKNLNLSIEHATFQQHIEQVQVQVTAPNVTENIFSANSQHGSMSNIMGYYSFKQPNVVIQGGIYNIFSSRKGFHHANIAVQSESMSPAQPLFPVERTALIQATYYF